MLEGSITRAIVGGLVGVAGEGRKTMDESLGARETAKRLGACLTAEECVVGGLGFLFALRVREWQGPDDEVCLARRSSQRENRQYL